jgi:hypothetical protein
VIGSANSYGLPADALWQAGKNFAALQRGEARRQGMIPTRRRALSRKMDTRFPKRSCSIKNLEHDAEQARENK